MKEGRTTGRSWEEGRKEGRKGGRTEMTERKEGGEQGREGMHLYVVGRPAPSCTSPLSEYGFMLDI
jgi:hypothetical protein